MKQRLLVTELWGLGDLVIASPFLEAASRRFEVTLLAKPYARELQPRFWPEVHVESFVAPWTAFRRKYEVWRWPWRRLLALRRMARPRFDLGLSARWDPRDHLLLWLLRARRRFGFPRINSQIFLTDPVARPELTAHRYENWRLLARALGFELPGQHEFPVQSHRPSRNLLIHTGAGQPVRVWPLDRYAEIARRLRAAGRTVQIACDPDQRAWWLSSGEAAVSTPRNVSELLALLDISGAFIGNDSGPAHLAALSGVPTFTLFGPQLPEWFAPLNPGGVSFEGKPCPYKPCSDYCRFPVPYCVVNSGVDEVWAHVLQFTRNLNLSAKMEPGEDTR